MGQVQKRIKPHISRFKTRFYKHSLPTCWGKDPPKTQDRCVLINACEAHHRKTEHFSTRRVFLLMSASFTVQLEKAYKTWSEQIV